MLQESDFTKLTTWSKQSLQYGDILLGSTVGNRKNHVMIFIDSETVLHQLKTSCYASLTHWYNRIDSVWRYSGELHANK